MEPTNSTGRKILAILVFIVVAFFAMILLTAPIAMMGLGQ